MSMYRKKGWIWDLEPKETQRIKIDEKVIKKNLLNISLGKPLTVPLRDIRKAYEAMYKKKTLIMRECAICHHVFFVKCNHQIYCDKESCKKKATQLLTRLSREKYKSKGICTRCRKRKTKKGYATCSKCITVVNQRRKKECQN